NSYSPAAIEYEGAPDMFRARVFDNIYRQATSGPPLQDSFIIKTWNIGHEQPGAAQTGVILQHMDATEMPVYSAYRDSSYINRYVGSVWDRLPLLPFLPQNGSLTTQAMGQP